MTIQHSGPDRLFTKRSFVGPKMLKLVLLTVCILACLCQSTECAKRNKPCSQTATCGGGYCCVTSNRPRGKRNVDDIPLGTCQPLGHRSSACLVNTGPYDPVGVYYSCPCRGGLVCKGSGLIEVPLGETGTCEPPATPTSY